MTQSLTEQEISQRLQARPDLVERLKGGDGTVLAEILEVTLGTEVKSTTVRLLA